MGDPRAQHSILGRWHEDRWKFRIEDYEDRNWRLKLGRARVLSCEKREMLRGCWQGLTLGAWSNTRRSQVEFRFKAARGLLLDRSLSANAAAWVLQVVLQPLVTKPVSWEALWQHGEIGLVCFSRESWHLEVLGQIIRRSSAS